MLLVNMKMKPLKLVLPSKKYLKSYQGFCYDFIKNGHTENYKTGYEKQLISSKKLLFLKWLHDDRKGINLEKGAVQQTAYWAIVDDKVVARANIRHKLNKSLQDFGHIGYDVKPKEQGKGYGTALLKQLIAKAKTIGLKKIIITCDEKNIGSRKVIERNGGKLKKIAPYHEKQYCYYWITL